MYPRLAVQTSWSARAAVALFSLGLMLATGCQRILSGPKMAEDEQTRPDQVVDFDKLYSANCAGCHGVDGKNGPAIAMNNPVYMALASDELIRSVTANGQTGNLMPAFARSAGGLLTDKQIDVIVSGMRQRWGKPVPGLHPPAYAATGKGDVAHGAQVYAQGCARCHGEVAAEPGAAAAKPGPAGSVVDPTFLALLSDQSLRTITIAGRPDLGQPDWRGDVPGRALTEAEITDVVDWMASHRAPRPGQTHPDPGGKTPAATELDRRVQ